MIDRDRVLLSAVPGLPMSLPASDSLAPTMSPSPSVVPAIMSPASACATVAW
jgi:hypothetical protein